MKCAIILADGIKQIMLTPENETERSALKLITPNDHITVEVKEGKLYNDAPQAARGYTVQESRGGYLRCFEDAESVMLVLRPKKKETTLEQMAGKV